MRKSKRGWSELCWLGLLLGYVTTPATAALSAGDFDLLTPDGEAATSPFVVSNQTATVFVFMAVDCPICQKYTPELNRLVGDFKARKIDFWFVFPDPDLNAGALKKAIAERPLKGHVVLDQKQRLAKFCDAQVTPEAVVINEAGVIVYRGRIDDRFPRLGVERQAKEHTLRLALDRLLSGKAVDLQERRAIGCQIPSLR